jgi:hypothetical protein
MVLGENGHPHAGSDGDFASVRIQLAREKIQEGGFTRPIRPDYAITIAGNKFEVYILEEKTIAKSKCEFGYAYHGTALFSYIRQDIQGG